MTAAVKRHTGTKIESVEITVTGTPVPQGSKTRTKWGVREDNPQTAPWRATVAAAGAEVMGEREPLTGPICLDVQFVFPRPRSHYGTGRNADRLRPSAPILHAVRPDADKLLRAIGDALTGIVWRDDAQIVIVSATKLYGRPAAHIIAREVTSREPL